uniref:DUF559 domain-containing protein n=1 Tax=viral metagenome TaxID=1070528 RepID=A0A6M3LM78_9ZZZZ
MATRTASDIELIVLRWLDKKGIIDFEFQSSFGGGRFELGGAVVDFLFTERSLAWRVQGDYYHTGMAKEATDSVQRELLESEGWIVVDLWGSDLKDPARREYTLQRALLGEEVF